MIQVGIIGASGFVGSRLTEIFHLEQIAKVVPIVRSTNSLARLARFSLEWRVADALDYDALVPALRGCDVVVHSVHGPNELIVEAPRVCYLAAQKAGVRRIIYLSTSSVHGQDPDPGTDESSPLHLRHRLAYNNAKVRAEREFMRLRRTGNVELVVLRPVIVFGPRDRWITNIALTILERKAYIVRGAGICNTVYVDNLIHAIRLAMTAPVDREVFIVADRETVTWSDLYRRISAALGTDWTVPEIEDPVVMHERVPLPDRLKELALARMAVPFIPRKWKLALREFVETVHTVRSAIDQARALRTANPWQRPGAASPNVPFQIALLHRCRYKFPYAKARTQMGYEPLFSVDEGLERTLAWLKFAGYPIVERPPF